MDKLIFDFGDTIDRTRFCRWHFCRCERILLLPRGIELLITFN